MSNTNKRRLLPIQRTNLRNIVTKYHNKALVKEHKVMHIWNDGRITETKGGDLYGCRTLFKIHVQLTDNNIFGRFPCKDKSFNSDPDASFAIVSELNALEIRNEMKSLLDMDEQLSKDLPENFVKDSFFEGHQVTYAEYCSKNSLENIIKLRGQDQKQE